MSELQIIALTPAVNAVPRPTLYPALYKECAIAVAACRAGAIGILDIEHKPAEFDFRAAAALLQAPGGSGATGIRCGAAQVPAMLDAVSEVLGEGGQLQYVIVPAADSAGGDAVERRIAAFIKEFGLKAVVEVLNVEQAVRAQAAGADVVLGKGSESPGQAGKETAFVLLQRLCKAVDLPVWIEGGIGTHTIAACAVGGAQGAVLESQLLLARESPLSAKQRAMLRRADGTETSSEWGQAAAWAASLADKGRTVSGIITELREALALHLEQAAAQNILGTESPLAQSHGTAFPILQGAMTRVSDTTQFASCVAQGGGLPFLALALMRKPQIEKLLSQCKTVLNKPWGVGVLGFVPEPLWHEQIETVLTAKPPYALIAGGRPDQSKMLEQAGIKTYLHVPSPLLLNAFIDEGARRFIFEGRECGGHVGPRSSFVLWQLMVDVLLEKVSSKEDASTYHIVFAGGIHDSVSAAMVAALAAPLAAAGMRVGVLLGTAYLFTREVVSSGAIVETFQHKAIECNTTALLETGPGHSIRVIDSPYRKTFEAQRTTLQGQNKGRDEIREHLELMNLGRLRVASKGLVRAAESGESPGASASAGASLTNTVSQAERYAELSAQVEPQKLQPVSSEQQWQDGMYMIGQVAALHDKTLTIEQLHKNISEEGQKHLQSVVAAQSTVAQAAATPAAVPTTPKTPIAIVGMSCMLPQANDVEKFWLNILNRVDSIIEVPEKYWDWKKLYDPDPLAPDKVVSKWGGFLDAIEFDPTSYGIPPSSMSSVDPMQLLILEVARRALIDAGYEERNFPKSKTAVILANAGHGPVTALYSLRSMLGWKLSNLPAEQRQRLEEILPEWTEDSFPGTLGNVTAGRVSNRFDLSGLNFAIDAACASSLAALYVSVNDLRNGGSDVVLLAATDTHNQPGDYLSFSKTHALSPDGRCKTFDATANGIAISEGIAVLVLKRLPDAEADGDTIYAVIRGVGGSSDGRALSLTAPRPAGQMLALQRAYEDAEVRPSSIALIEAHGTGTVAGDKAEVEALSKMFSADGASNQICAVGSVKSNIGHTKCTAGLASIIKVSKALHHKVLPPTIGVKTPNAACNFSESPFYISSETRPWFAAVDDQPRRAGVSAFGFGGTNFHAVLEEYRGGVSSGASMCLPSELFVFKAASASELKKQLTHFESDLRAQLKFAGSSIDEAALLSLAAFKLYLRSAEHSSSKPQIVAAVVATTMADLLKKLQTIAAMPEEQIERGVKDPQGIYLQNAAKLADSSPPSIAFLFPGQGSQRLNMLADLSMHFPAVRAAFEQADFEQTDRGEQQITKFVFPPPSFSEQETQLKQQQLTNTSAAQVALGVADLAVYKLLREFAITPSMLAGHSYGEYAALAAAGTINEIELLRISALRGKLMSQCTGGAMAAIAGKVAEVAAATEATPSVVLANHNAPQQCVLSGPENEIDSAIKTLREKGYDARKLPVSGAFHTASMQKVCNELESALKTCNVSLPEFPVYSNLTAQPHAADATSIVRNLVEHTTKPVRFMQEIEQMYADGARIFVEVGPGSVLSSLVDNILTDKPHLAISTDRAGRNGVVQLQHTLALLAVNGVNLDLSPLFEHRFQELEIVEHALKKAKESATNKKATKYVVNSYSIERIGEGNKLLPVGGQIDRLVTSAGAGSPGSPSIAAGLNAGGANTIPSSTPPYSLGNREGLGEHIQPLKLPDFSSIAASNGDIESVMLQFQQTMMQMTNNFLQAQQNVMLAYLNSVSGTPSIAPATTPATAPAITPVTVAAHSTPSTPATIAPSSVPPPSTNGAAALNADELIAGLIDIVSERTGYPPEMLEPHLDLEADLGIDSIKRIEILSTFRKMLPPQVVAQLEGSVEKIASTRTLAGIFDWIRETLSSVEDAPEASSNPTLEQSNPPTPEQSTPTQPQTTPTPTSSAQGKIARGLVKVIDLPCLTNVTAHAPSGVILVCGADLSTSAGVKIIELLRKRGLNVADVNQRAAAFGPIAGLVYLGAVTQRSYNTDDVVSLAETLKLLKKDLDDSGRKLPFVLAATKLGGSFGFGECKFESYEQAGIVGLVKTLSREWADVRSRVVDFEATASAEEISDHLMDEINDLVVSDTNDQIEVGYLQTRRCGLQIDPAALAETPVSVPASLNNTSVILLTGGARGVTAQLAIAFAKKFQPTLILVGRQPQPTGDDFAHLQSAREMKTAIMESMQQTGQDIVLAEVEAQYKNILKNREITQTITAIKNTGATVEYHCLNVCDEAAFSKFIDDIYERYEQLDGVIHGAGIIEDAYLINKQSESFKRVVDTKVVSANTLARKLRFDQLQFMFFLSSVVSRTGNTGQADYVAANEILNKMAVKLNRNHKARIASLLWGPWNGGMARPELESLFARYGWTMISNEQGSDAFMNELIAGAKADEEVLLVAQVAAAQSPDTPEAAIAHDDNGNGNGHAYVEAHAYADAHGNGNGNGHAGADDNGNGNGNGHESALIVNASGARLFNSYALEKDGDAMAVHFTLSTEEDLYLNDHCLDGMPVLPMAMATELLAEAGATLDGKLRPTRITNLRIPSGVIFDENSKNFMIRLEPAGSAATPVFRPVKAYLSSVGSKEHTAAARVRFTGNIELSNRLTPAQLPAGMPLRYVPQQFTNAVAAADLPVISEAYQKWFFHGPMFQGIQEILALGIDGIAGSVLGSYPNECLKTANEEHWLVDPILLDSAMQLAGIWAWKYLDMMVLPTGFRSLSLFGAPTGQVHHVIVRIPQAVTALSDHSELLCDLAIYGPSGHMIMLMEGLSGIGSRSFNRLAAQPKELRS